MGIQEKALTSAMPVLHLVDEVALDIDRLARLRRAMEGLQEQLVPRNLRAPPQPVISPEPTTPFLKGGVWRLRAAAATRFRILIKPSVATRMTPRLTPIADAAPPCSAM